MQWKCPVKWGKPRRDAARKVELTDMAIEKLKRMGSVDIMSFLAGREMPVGDHIGLQAAAKLEARDRAASAAPAECRHRRRQACTCTSAALDQLPVAAAAMNAHCRTT